MSSPVVTSRSTKYCRAIEIALAEFGHATNAQLLDELRKDFPELSATTVHRATARLAARGKIGIAPSLRDGTMRYDSNATPHDHFSCSSCDLLRDADVKGQVVSAIESSIGDGCSISGRLTISGLCKRCT